MSEPVAIGEAPPREGGRVVAVLSAVAAFCLAATVAMAFVQVVLRFVFNNPQAWAEEVGRYLFVWLAFLGAALAVAHDIHIRVDVLESRANPRFRTAFLWLRRGVDLICFGFLMVSGGIVAWKNRFSEFYTIEGAPQVIFYLAVPVGCAFMLYFLVLRMSGRR
jgi:C4-dicarboxylate transporter DctQ subunit